MTLCTHEEAAQDDVVVAVAAEVVIGEMLNDINIRAPARRGALSSDGSTCTMDVCVDVFILMISCSSGHCVATHAYTHL